MTYYRFLISSLSFVIIGETFTAYLYYLNIKLDIIFIAIFILPFILGVIIYNIMYARLYLLFCTFSILITALWSHFRVPIILICVVLMYIPLIYLFIKSKKYSADNVELILVSSKFISIFVISIVALAYFLMFILIR